MVATEPILHDKDCVTLLMGSDLCECMRPLMEIQQEIESLATEGKNDEISLLLTRVDELSKNGDECIAGLEKKYGTLDVENEKKANEAFKNACPDIAAMLEEAAEEGE